MNDQTNTTEPETVPCEVCMKEIPSSEAKTSEVDDYVMHFCGIDCYDKWQKDHTENK